MNSPLNKDHDTLMNSYKSLADTTHDENSPIVNQF